jgi:immune inhibitor A
MDKRWLWVLILVVGLCLFICCICLFLFAGLFVYNVQTSPDGSGALFQQLPALQNTATPVVVRPLSTPLSGSKPPDADTGPEDPTPSLATSVPPAEITSGTEEVIPFDIALATLNDLEQTVVPINDMRELARRLKGIQNIPLTVDPPAGPFFVGDQKIFWAINVDNNRPFQVDATLRYETDHLYFWIEDGVRYSESDLRELAETFESSIYPTTREFFGSEWKPGVDGDPHLYVLYAPNLGRNLAGYFSSADSYHPLAHPYSNAHEMFFLNADVLSLSNPFTYGVLAHEFQHMIHWHQDRNETSWLNEGFSELAAFLNGYYEGGFDALYAKNPSIQLNDWPNSISTTAPHYGASFLFVNYFLGRFGEDLTRALVAHPDNGLVSIDNLLLENDVQDPITGEIIGADDVFIDWLITSFVNDETIGDGRYTYAIYPQASQAVETIQISDCPLEVQTRGVNQYGADYIRITCNGDYLLDFEGSLVTNLLPVDPYSGKYAFWSNKGDESNMTLTRHFDLREERGPLTLSYWTWFDIEEDYDYVYVSASTDGERWRILQTTRGTDENPSGNSYGWGYNGASAGGPKWVHEIADISRYAGNEVYLRFEYVTDAAVHGEGFLLDDVSIPETGYFTDFETDDDGWQANGFVRIQNVLPQTYRLALISKGETISVEYIPVSTDVTAQIPISIGEDVDEVILVVSGTTRFTRQEAAYRFSIMP